MKKFISVLLVFMVGTVVFGQEALFNLNPGSKNSVPQSTVSVDDIAFERYVKEIVPANYREAMIYYTKDPRVKPYRPLIMGIADQESEGWKYFTSHKPNYDGSIDHSPMQLNSKNIASPEFMATYAPKDRSRIKTKYNLYMVTAINYLIDFCIPKSKSGLEGSLAMYNAGPKKYFNNDIPDTTYIYIYRVLLKSERIEKKLNSYASEETLKREDAVKFFRNKPKAASGLAFYDRYLQPFKPEDYEYEIEREEMVRTTALA